MTSLEMTTELDGGFDDILSAMGHAAPDFAPVLKSAAAAPDAAPTPDVAPTPDAAPTPEVAPTPDAAPMPNDVHAPTPGEIAPEEAHWSAPSPGMVAHVSEPAPMETEPTESTESTKPMETDQEAGVTDQTQGDDAAPEEDAATPAQPHFPSVDRQCSKPSMKKIMGEPMYGNYASNPTFVGKSRAETLRKFVSFLRNPDAVDRDKALKILYEKNDRRFSKVFSPDALSYANASAISVEEIDYLHDKLAWHLLTRCNVGQKVLSKLKLHTVEQPDTAALQQTIDTLNNTDKDMDRMSANMYVVVLQLQERLKTPEGPDSGKFRFFFITHCAGMDAAAAAGPGNSSGPGVADTTSEDEPEDSDFEPMTPAKAATPKSAATEEEEDEEEDDDEEEEKKLPPKKKKANRPAAPKRAAPAPASQDVPLKPNTEIEDPRQKGKKRPRRVYQYLCYSAALSSLVQTCEMNPRTGKPEGEQEPVEITEAQLKLMITHEKGMLRAFKKMLAQPKFHGPMSADDRAMRDFYKQSVEAIDLQMRWLYCDDKKRTFRPEIRKHLAIEGAAPADDEGDDDEDDDEEEEPSPKKHKKEHAKKAKHDPQPGPGPSPLAKKPKSNARVIESEDDDVDEPRRPRAPLRAPPPPVSPRAPTTTRTPAKARAQAAPVVFERVNVDALSSNLAQGLQNDAVTCDELIRRCEEVANSLRAKSVCSHGIDKSYEKSGSHETTATFQQVFLRLLVEGTARAWEISTSSTATSRVTVSSILNALRALGDRYEDIRGYDACVVTAAYMRLLNVGVSKADMGCEKSAIYQRIYSAYCRPTDARAQAVLLQPIRAVLLPLISVGSRIAVAHINACKDVFQEPPVPLESAAKSPVFGVLTLGCALLTMRLMASVTQVRLEHITAPKDPEMALQPPPSPAPHNHDFADIAATVYGADMGDIALDWTQS